MDYTHYVDHIDNTGPANWSDLPSIKLIKSQLVEIMDDQHVGNAIFEDEKYKSSMVNHFAKKGVVPRTTGKKYSKNHIAAHTIAAMLKQLLSPDEMREIMVNGMGDGKEIEDDKIKEFYELFKKELEDGLGDCRERTDALKEKSPAPVNKELAAKVAMELAVSSYVTRLFCRTIIHGYLTDDEK